MAQEGWELVKSNTRVAVYTKHKQGNHYKSFKAIGIVQSTPEQLLKILDNVSGYKQWFAYLKMYGF